MLTNWPVSIWYKFLQRTIFETGYWNLILIPIIPRNMFKLHTKKIYTKYDKICVFEKSPHENYHGEKKSWAEWSGISLLFSKSMPWLDRVYIGSFFNLYMTLPDTTKTGNWWNSKFSKLSQLFTNKCSAFLAFWHPIFKREKRNDVGRAHEACCNGRQLI